MLTEEQVKNHSEVSVTDMPDEDARGVYRRSMARLLYIHNERASRMKIVCMLPEPLPQSRLGAVTENEIKCTIDWEKFTAWINRHDDLTEENLGTMDEWLEANRAGKPGRHGLLDTIRNETIDCNKLRIT